MIRYRISYGLIFIGLILFYIFCNSYVPLLILIVFISLTVLSIVGTVIASKLISIEAGASHSVITRGEDSDAQFSIDIRNGSVLPISAVSFRLEFRDKQERGVIERKMRTTLAASENRTVYTMVSTAHTSYVECRVCDVYIYDAFGLMRRRIKKGKFSTHMTVMPVMADSDILKESPLSYTDDSDRYSDTGKGDDPSQVFEVREYAEGDDIRRIHWGLSSKQDILMVKEFSQPVSDSCVILLETGIVGDTPDARKSVTDGLMSVFMKLSDELIRCEQMFSVYWYSKQSESVVCFDVCIYDDVFPVVEGFLSMEYSSEICGSLIHTSDMFMNLDKRVYYIYSSSCCKAESISSLQEKYYPVNINDFSA